MPNFKFRTRRLACPTGATQRTAAAQLEFQSSTDREGLIRKLRNIFKRDAGTGQVEFRFLGLRVIENVAGDAGHALAQVRVRQLDFTGLGVQLRGEAVKLHARGLDVVEGEIRIQHGRGACSTGMDTPLRNP